MNEFIIYNDSNELRVLPYKHKNNSNNNNNNRDIKHYYQKHMNMNIQQKH